MLRKLFDERIDDFKFNLLSFLAINNFIVIIRLS